MPSDTINPVARAVHEQALAACTTLRSAEHALAVVLARIHVERLHHDFGYANVLDYAEDLLGLTRSKAEGLLRLGRSLERLPELDRAWAAGEVAWTKARTLLRILTSDNEAAWIERARQVSVRQLEHDVSLTLMGEPPPEGVEPPKAPARKRLSFEVDTVQADQLKAAIQWVRSTLGDETDDVSDGEILAALVERVIHDLTDPEVPTAERFKVVVEHCPTCGHTSGMDAELTDTTILTAACDHETLEMREGPTRGHLTHDVAPATRRAVIHRDRCACRVPGCHNRLYLDVHHVKPRALGGGHEEANLVTICTIHHRLTHDGRLAIEANGGNLVFTFPSGRVVERPFGSRRYEERPGRVTKNSAPCKGLE